ncbi:hypothetical protein CCMA1212_010339 [Trichoderma ghanense]|uniref:Uncharacterized protein n=1 Tax=Trichoderma ghanense TaxID=65468 RepID=A0ABY2GR07_9HYPO
MPSSTAHSAADSITSHSNGIPPPWALSGPSRRCFLYHENKMFHPMPDSYRFGLYYIYGRLIMNRDFYGFPKGLPLECLECSTLVPSWGGGPLWQEDHSVKIINDELFICTAHTISGKASTLRDAIDEGRHGVCMHIATDPVAVGDPSCLKAIFHEQWFASPFHEPKSHALRALEELMELSIIEPEALRLDAARKRLRRLRRPHRLPAGTSFNTRRNISSLASARFSKLETHLICGIGDAIRAVTALGLRHNRYEEI